MKTDTKITVRISKMELDAIDDFLVRHLEYKTRSDFIRYAVMKEIELMDKVQYPEETISINLNKKILSTFEDLVDLGLFKDIGEVVDYFLSRYIQTRRFEEELATLLQGYSGTDRLIDNYKMQQEDRISNRLKKGKGEMNDR
ncbi:MAG: ribbon-helix-helix domain-containing protein [Thermoplasmata archaeon]